MKVVEPVIVSWDSDGQEASATDVCVCGQRNNSGDRRLLRGAWHVLDLLLEGHTNTIMLFFLKMEVIFYISAHL